MAEVISGIAREAIAEAKQPKIRKYRDLALEVPKDALPGALPVPDGMKAWVNAGNGFTVVACHYTADPKKRNDEWYTWACKALREDQIEREMEINFDSKAGAKAFPYLEPNAALYRRDPPMPIPAHWTIIAGLDYGARNPTAFTWFAVDEFRRFWAFDEFYCPMIDYEEEGGLPAFAEWIKKHEYYPRLRYIVADPSIFNRNQNQLEMKENGQIAYGTVMSIAELLMKFGIHKLQRGNNDRLAGMTRLQQMFNWRGDVKNTNPFVFFGGKCKKAWWEFINIVYKLDDKETKNADEDVVKRNDHAFDEWKYALLSQDLPAGAPAVDPRAGFATLKSVEDEIDEMQNNNKDNTIFFDDFDSEID